MKREIPPSNGTGVSGFPGCPKATTLPNIRPAITTPFFIVIFIVFRLIGYNY
jgi:hypothetical protein